MPPRCKDAINAGATLSTHLGNGIASPLARHPNPIWLQAANDGLHASLIADGHHLSPEVLRVLARAKGADRTILVSDASPLAGLPVGRYGDWAVDPSGKIVVAGTPYLAGSNQGLVTGVQTLQQATGWPLDVVLDCCSARPAALLGLRASQHGHRRTRQPDLLRGRLRQRSLQAARDLRRRTTRHRRNRPGYPHLGPTTPIRSNFHGLDRICRSC